MPGALLDTNAVSDLMRDQPQIKARVGRYPNPLASSVIVAGEIYYGLHRLPIGKKRHDLAARALAVLTTLRQEPITAPIAEIYGQLKATLEGQGQNVQDNDLWIAATAITGGSVLVTRDQIFQKIPGIQAEDWTV